MDKLNKRDLIGKEVQNRAVAETALIDVENRTIPFIIVSDENAGMRYDWREDEEFMEVLDPKGATFEGLNTLFKDHNHSVDNAIGKVVNTRLEGVQIKADVIFGTDPQSDIIFNKYREGILTDVSIGYQIKDVEITRKKDETTIALVTNYDIKELSAVWKGFDRLAKVGRNAEQKTEEEDKKETDNSETIIRARRIKMKAESMKMSQSTGS